MQCTCEDQHLFNFGVSKGVIILSSYFLLLFSLLRHRLGERLPLKESDDIHSKDFDF